MKSRRVGEAAGHRTGHKAGGNRISGGDTGERTGGKRRVSRGSRAKRPVWTEREKPRRIYVGTPDGTCERVSEHFTNQINIPLSAGSVCNFKEEAYNKLEWFEVYTS
jgi:hypothetical protein